MHLFETYGTSHHRSYIIESKENITTVRIKSDNAQWQWKSFNTIFMAIFLPHGYPDSVSKDYVSYQIWDSIQAFSSSISGGLCTHAILKGVGVGDETASPIAATITWLLKDGSSMVGRIMFAWFKGTKLDSDCKKWRLFADIVNDVAMLLDLVSGYFQEYFLAIICISGVFKAIVGVAGSCTRAALTQHQARNNNMADVSAKDGSQETLVNLLALICNLMLVPFLSSNHILTWLLFSVMTLIHLISNYLAVKSVTMETLNEERFKIYANHYFKEGMEKRKYLSVNEVNKKENVLFFNSSTTVSIKLGTSFSNMIHNKKNADIEKIVDLYKDCNYILGLSRKKSKDYINVVFNKKSSVDTYMEALFQACYISYLLEHNSTFYDDIENFSTLEEASKKFTMRMFQDFINSLKAMQFNTSIVIFDIDLWRADW